MSDLALVGDGDGEMVEGVPSRAFAVRQGTLLFRDDGESGKSIEQALAALCDALKSDSRVKDFDRPAHRPHASRRDVMYPHLSHERADIALVGGDHFHSLRFSDPILLELAIPNGSEKPFRGADRFPAGNYFVAWNGVTVAVGWDQRSDETVSRSAGRVALELLTEATKKAGFATYGQPCSPNCQNRFTHVDALIVPVGARRVDPRPSLLVIERESVPKANEALLEWFEAISYRGFLFAIYKNHARRIRELDDLAGLRLQQLLHMRQLRQSASLASGRERRAIKKSLKGWRKRSRKYVADIWLAAASIEVGRALWDEERRRFHERNAHSTVGKVFEGDVKDDEAAVDGIDLQFARSALEYSAARLDAQVLAVVTGLAGASGIVGGVVGAVIGAAIGS